VSPCRHSGFGYLLYTPNTDCPDRARVVRWNISSGDTQVNTRCGGIEVLGLLQDRLGLKGVFWDAIGSLNEHFGLLGYVVIGVFIVSWIVSIAIYKLRRYDDINVKTL